MEPNWDEVRERLMAMTTKQLRSIGREWFNGILGGASTKADIAATMATQMRNWWLNCAEWGGRERVANVLKAIEREEVDA